MTQDNSNIRQGVVAISLLILWWAFWLFKMPTEYWRTSTIFGYLILGVVVCIFGTFVLFNVCPRYLDDDWRRVTYTSSKVKEPHPIRNTVITIFLVILLFEILVKVPTFLSIFINHIKN